MRTEDTFDVIYTHTEGEPLGIIYGGIPYPPGSSILEKRRFLEENYDWLRKAVMREPRGHSDMFGVFLTPPSGPDYDAGLIYIDGTEYSHMCGHGTIAVSMAIVARGLVPRGPGGITTIRFETTAGLVTAEGAPGGGNGVWTRLCRGAGRGRRAARLRQPQGGSRVGRQLLRHHRSSRHGAAHRAGERQGVVADGPDRA